MRDALAGLMHGRDDPHVGGQGTGVSKCEQIDFRDDAGGGVGANPVDGRQELAYSMLAEAAVDVAVEAFQTFPERRNVLARISSL